MSHHTEILYSYEPKSFSEALNILEGNALSPSDRESIRTGAYRLYEVNVSGNCYVVAKNPSEVEKAVADLIPEGKENKLVVDQEVRSVFEVTNYDRLDPKNYGIRVICSDKEFHKGKPEPKLKAIVEARLTEKERKIAELKKQLAVLEALP